MLKSNYYAAINHQLMISKNNWDFYLVTRGIEDCAIRDHDLDTDDYYDIVDKINQIYLNFKEEKKNVLADRCTVFCGRGDYRNRMRREREMNEGFKNLVDTFYKEICEKRYGDVCGTKCPFHTVTCERALSMMTDKDVRRMQRALKIVKSGNIPSNRKEW